MKSSGGNQRDFFLSFKFSNSLFVNLQQPFSTIYIWILKACHMLLNAPRFEWIRECRSEWVPLREGGYQNITGTLLEC